MNNIITNPSEIQLSAQHSEILKTISGIDPDIIQQRGYCSISDKTILRGLGFAPKQCRVPGLLIPIHTPDNLSSSLCMYKPVTPRETSQKKKFSGSNTAPIIINNEMPNSMGVRLDCPPACLENLKDPKVPLYITDHPQKSDSLASRGICAVSLLGIWGFKGKNSLGGTVFLADWDYVALDQRIVHIIYDSDDLNNQENQKAIFRLIEHLQRNKAQVNKVQLPVEPCRGESGIDEWLAAGHAVDELIQVSEIQQDALQSTAPLVTIIDEEHAEMARPLSLVNKKGYAATWAKVEITVPQEISKEGKLIQNNPPKKIIEKRLIVMSDDGEAFGGSKSLESLGFEVSLGEKPNPDKIWSGAGIRRYKKGERPNPSDVLGRLIQVIDHYIDFNKSLADQNTMCELIACWIIATWFLDAFNVTGYLWLNGEKGSGKSDLLGLIAELSYLGLLISNSSSFASIRDMADYGATLAFDDAEGITSFNEKDQDKRTLLLAGNHRGVTVTVKVPGPDKTWQTKYINAFCPRAFSAIRVPDPVLMSRIILIPLVRTSDEKRGNIDSADYEGWPCERRLLIDDLWAMGIYFLSQMPNFDKWVGLNTSLVGRNLQPWKNILAVAKWLEGSGVPNLYQRMHNLALDYQTKRPELELPDTTRLVIQALCNHAICAIKAISAINMKNVHFETKVSDIVDFAKSIVDEDELDIDKERITTRSIGKLLGRLRFDKVPRPGGKGSRLWKIEFHHLFQLAKSYNVTLPEELIGIIAEQPKHLKVNGTDGTNGTDGSGPMQDCPTIFESQSIMKPERPCNSCGSMEYWQRPDGGFVCNICHPQN